MTKPTCFPTSQYLDRKHALPESGGLNAGSQEAAESNLASIHSGPRWEAEREGTEEEAALGFACVSRLSSQTCKTTTELSDSRSLLWRRGEESLTPFACTLGPGKIDSYNSSRSPAFQAHPTPNSYAQW